MVQIADITGVYGVSFLIVWVKCRRVPPPGSLGRSKLEAGPRRNPGRRFPPGPDAGYGYWRLAGMSRKARKGPRSGSPSSREHPAGREMGPKFQEETMRIYTDLNLRTQATFPS